MEVLLQFGFTPFVSTISEIILKKKKQNKQKNHKTTTSKIILKNGTDSRNTEHF